MAGSRSRSNVISLQLDKGQKEHEGALLLNLRNIETPPPQLGSRQSPIDILSSECKFDGSLLEKAFQVVYPRRLCSGCAFLNTGHTWKLCIGQSDRYSIRGGPLEDCYSLDQIHAHWGPNDHCGSEHLVDGKPFSGEMHFVHWNKEKYDTIGEALKYEDGLAVIGVFFKVGRTNLELAKLTKLMESVTEPDSKSEILDRELDLHNLLPLNTSDYWTYLGSLTTEPYSECVTWIVLQQPIEVSRDQLNRMRSLLCHQESHASEQENENRNMTSNYRPVQRHDLYVVRCTVAPESPLQQQQLPINIQANNVFVVKSATESPLYVKYSDVDGINFENTGQSTGKKLSNIFNFLGKHKSHKSYEIEEFSTKIH